MTKMSSKMAVYQKRKESLTCTICHDIFENPYALKCHHHFCKEKCIDKLHIDGSGQVSCPLCKAKCLLTEIKLDCDFKYQLDMFKSESEPDIDGPSCLCAKPASFLCLDCCSFLCLNCGQSHCKIPSCKEHAVDKIEDLTAQAVKGFEVVMEIKRTLISRCDNIVEHLQSNQTELQKRSEKCQISLKNAQNFWHQAIEEYFLQKSTEVVGRNLVASSIISAQIELTEMEQQKEKDALANLQKRKREVLDLAPDSDPQVFLKKVKEATVLQNEPDMRLHSEPVLDAKHHYDNLSLEDTLSGIKHEFVVLSGKESHSIQVPAWELVPNLDDCPPDVHGEDMASASHAGDDNNIAAYFEDNKANLLETDESLHIKPKIIPESDTAVSRNDDKLEDIIVKPKQREGNSSDENHNSEEDIGSTANTSNYFKTQKGSEWDVSEFEERHTESESTEFKTHIGASDELIPHHNGQVQGIIKKPTEHEDQSLMTESQLVDTASAGPHFGLSESGASFELRRAQTRLATVASIPEEEGQNATAVIPLKGQVSRISLINDDLWIIPHPSNGYIKVHDATTGRSKDPLKVENFDSKTNKWIPCNVLAVTQCSNGDIITACYGFSNKSVSLNIDIGLLEIDSDGNMEKIILPEKVMDVTSSGDYIYAILESGEIREYRKALENRWERLRQIPLKRKGLDRIVYHEKQLFLSSRYEPYITCFHIDLDCEVQEDSPKIESKDGKSVSLYLCCVKPNGSVIIADQFNHELLFVEPDSNWNIFNREKQKFKPLDAILDPSKNLWVLGFDQKYRLFKL